MNNPILNTEPTARDKIRAAIRQGMVDGGFPADHLDETLDLALHASEQAMAALERVVTSSMDWRVILVAAPLACQLLAHDAEQRGKIAMRVGKAMGGTSFEANVEVKL